MAVTLSVNITQNSQNIANNTSNITVNAVASWTGGSWNRTGSCYGHIVIDGTKYSFSNLTFNDSETQTGSKTVMSKTVDVKHDSDGKKTVSFSASFRTGVSSGTIAASASKTLDRIYQKSTLSVGNGTLNTSQSLTVTRQSTSFTHTIVATCGSASSTLCTKSTSTSISFTPPLSWASQNTTGTSVSVTYKITTYNGDTSIGSNSYTKSCSIPASVKPSCTVAISDPTGHLSTYGGYIKGYSKFKVTVTPTQSYGSAIASYKTTANGSTYASASFTTDVLRSSGTLKVSSTVTDKRGRTSSASSVSATVLDYSPPNISKLTVGRCDEDGTANDQGEYVVVTYAYSISSLNSKNSSTCTLRYKKSSVDEYTTPTDFESSTNGSYIFAADTGSSYDVTLSVTDDLNTITKNTSVSTAFTIMHWRASGYGMGIGKISELDDVLDVGFQTRLTGGLLHPVLEPDTDLDDVRSPNTYVGANVSSYNYVNCPIDSGTFTLEVVGMGDAGQVKQRFTRCHKTEARVYERIYYSSAWSEWVCVSDYAGTLLATPNYYMSASQTVTLSEPISNQPNGIVLIFSKYSDGVVNESFSAHFVPKKVVSLHGGKGFNFNLNGMWSNGMKYLYIYDTQIVGHDNNNLTERTLGGITYNNKFYVLRYVIGV